MRSPPFGAYPRTPRRLLNFALGRRAAVTSVLDDLPAAQESPTAAAAAPVGTPGNVPVGVNDGVDEAVMAVVYVDPSSVRSVLLVPPA